ncbi:MAG TPA: polyhydroxyalkanoate depolymerase [Myxococcaceae bacterium]|nr:polyhydroxyalkanoate depolymerase [Myxococcaceae bacterium]
MYRAYQLQRGLREPLHLWASLARAVWSHPALPPTPLSRALAAASELWERSTRVYPKPSFGLDSTRIGGRTVAVRETVVERTPFCNLVRFEREAGRDDPRVLLVAPLSGHHATLLRETVRELLPDHDLYLTDWMDARLVPAEAGRFDLDDYIDLLVRWLRLLGPDLHVVAVCQPAVPVLAAVSLLAEEEEEAQPRTLSLFAGPIDTRRSPTEVNRHSRDRPLEWFERWVVHEVPASEPGAGRKVCPGFIQLAGFVSLNADRHLASHWKLFRDLLVGDEDGAAATRRFYDEYLAVMDLPAEYYLQTVRVVFQEHALARGELLHRGRPVRPAAVRRTALLTVEGEADDITGLGQTEAAHGLCSGIPEAKKQHHHQPGAGHYGVFSGRRWREEIAPRLRAFFRAHAAGGRG